jgi:hypothetical protein
MGISIAMFIRMVGVISDPEVGMRNARPVPLAPTLNARSRTKT